MREELKHEEAVLGQIVARLDEAGARPPQYG
jgi:hypothetical protein